MAKSVSIRDYEDTASVLRVVSARAPGTWRDAACEYIDRCLAQLSGRLHRERSFDQDDTCRSIVALRSLRSTILEQPAFDIPAPQAFSSHEDPDARLARVLMPPKHRQAILDALAEASAAAEEAGIEAGPGEARRQSFALLHEIDAFRRFLEESDLAARSSAAANQRVALQPVGVARAR